MTLFSFLFFSCHARAKSSPFFVQRAGVAIKKTCTKVPLKNVERKKQQPPTNQPLLSCSGVRDSIASLPRTNSKHAHTTGGLHGPPSKTVPASKPSGIRSFHNRTPAAWRLVVVQPQSQQIYHRSHGIYGINLMALREPKKAKTKRNEKITSSS